VGGVVEAGGAGGAEPPRARAGERFFEDLSRVLNERQRFALTDSGLTPAAVLVPLYLGERDSPHLVLTRRPEGMKAHSGQVAFPGGSVEPEDRDALATALREAHEEIGLEPSLVRPLGRLDDRPVVTGFVMTPWVARIPAGLVWRPQAAEVARVFELPLEQLVDPLRTKFRFEVMNRTGFPVAVPFFETANEIIWGATGRILLQLLELCYGFSPEEPSI
jgi:8-oxo-dGTP pyrophosphatase MutT (NUDIX family)